MSSAPKPLSPDEVARLFPRRAFVLMYDGDAMEHVAKWNVDDGIQYSGASAEEALGKLVYGLLELARDNLARAKDAVEQRRHELCVIASILDVDVEEYE